MAIYKPQSPIEKGEHYIYPLTTHDQVILPNGSRWNGEYIDVDLDKAADGTVVLSNADKLGGKAPEYYIQPRNLLDNSDFSDLVAQAGLPGMHRSSPYLADRWALTHNNVTVTKNNGYCSITRDSTYKTSLCQRIPGNFAGKTLTIAAKIRCVDKVFLGFYRHDSTKIDNKSFVGLDGIVCYSITLPEDATDVAIRVYLAYDDPSASVDIYWMALYEGEYTAETLPPYVPKGYGAELAECRRYYQQYVFVDAIKLSSGLYTVSYYHGMRTNPTITFVTFEPYGSPTITDFTDCSIV